MLSMPYIPVATYYGLIGTGRHIDVTKPSLISCVAFNSLVKMKLPVWELLVDAYELYTHIHQSCFTGTETIAGVK